MNLHKMLTHPVTRRALFGGLLAAPLGAHATSSVAPVRPLSPAEMRRAQQRAAQRVREQRTPNVELLDHNGRKVRFYDDVMKGHKVLLNVMYTVCSNTCTPSTRNLIEARGLLGDLAKQLRFVSITLTPLTDGPEELRAFKKRYGIGEDWIFLTGKLENVERVQRGLGFITDREDEDLLSHSSMVRFCDERNLRWGHANTLLEPRSIARMIRFDMV